ncbi:hypothetical protein DL96DRAFT_1608588, partial [Flagelloscypha sp. PMI_526]
MTPFDVLSLSSVSRSMRQIVTHENFFSMVLHNMLTRGNLRWILPCHSVENEVKNANKALATWIAVAGLEAPLNHPRFPILPFVHTCFVHSNSMKSRRRLWGIIKQLEKRWTAFRNGELEEEAEDHWSMTDEDYEGSDWEAYDRTDENEREKEMPTEAEIEWLSDFLQVRKI